MEQTIKQRTQPTSALNSATKRQSAEWLTPCLPNKRSQECDVQSKNNACCFFRHKRCGPKGVWTSRIDRQRCLLRRCSRKIEKKGPPSAKRDRRYLGYSIMTTLQATPLCGSVSSCERNLATLPQPPYSPGLVPADFFLFHRIKTILKERRLDGIEVIQAAVTTTLNEVSVEAITNRVPCLGKSLEKMCTCSREVR